MEQAFALQALAHAGVDQQLTRPMLDQAGADPALDVVAAAVLQDDRFDTLKVQEMRQHQPGGACTNNSDLRSHRYGRPRLERKYLSMYGTYCTAIGLTFRPLRLCSVANGPKKDSTFPSRANLTVVRSPGAGKHREGP